MPTPSYNDPDTIVRVVVVSLWIGILNFWLDFTGMNYLYWLWILFAAPLIRFFCHCNRLSGVTAYTHANDSPPLVIKPPFNSRRVRLNP
jgi:hypothetical protein